MSTDAPLLHARDVTVRFGGVVALDAVNLIAHRGAISGLIGPNGAGKTTLFNAITGIVPLAGGRIELDGDDITGWPTHRRGRAGIIRTFQRLELFTGLSVRDNLLAAWESSIPGAVLGRNRRTGRRIADDLIEQLDLGGLADRMAGQLSTGQGRIVELARALAAQPRVLLLDEPSSGLDPAETAVFRDLLLRVVGRETGEPAILLVEHDVSLVMQVCDGITVLDFGVQIATGPPDVIRADERVIAAYLGEDDAA